MKRGSAPRRHKIKVLVCNRVSPVDKLLEQFASALVPRVQNVHHFPQINSQPVEIGTDRAGVRVATTKASTPYKLHPKESSKRRGDDCNYLIDALRMKISAEALELGRQEGRVGLVDLLRRITPAPVSPANHRVRVFDLV
jgi:hypothetical protein